MKLEQSRAGEAGDLLSVPAAIRQRRSTSRFHRGRPVPKLLLGEVLKLATLAPSSFNLQPWRFIVVRDEKYRQKLRACGVYQPKLSEAPVVVIVLGYHHPNRSHLDAMLAIQEQSGIITSDQAAEWRSRAQQAMQRVVNRALWATRFSMLAAATMMLAAESLGLSSALMEGFDPLAVRSAFGIPDDHTVCCLVALGHAAEPKPFPGRFGLEEVCYSEHFGCPWTFDDSKTA
jgi:nitroreductase